MNTEIIRAKTQKQIAQYLEVSDPLHMMSLLMQFAQTRRYDLSDEQYREISCCHNLLAAIFRNE